MYEDSSLKRGMLWIRELPPSGREFISRRIDLIIDLYLAQARLPNFTITLSVKQSRPKIWEIRFTSDDLSKYEILKRFAGEYGFVVPTKWSKSKRILRGEKRLKYVF